MRRVKLRMQMMDLSCYMSARRAVLRVMIYLILQSMLIAGE